ncbi:hypothetical protein [Roseovarius sp. M141]|uniref:hypothetical protein n=1 Tax=Roseovarius sp. M141 TaxID=2583806 RepID=UPI0020CF7580|nr:hypothetical protein [Roseovarius sp. M141]MCQ0090476.1 hypothetical protein [Roseovarius sp. M141]
MVIELDGYPKSENQTWLRLTVLVVFVLIFTSMKTIRFPIPYPAGLFAINYDQGIIKRALVGSILFPGDTPISYATIALVSVVIFLVLLFLLAATSAQILRSHPELFLIVLLYTSSFGVVFLASTTGYFDHILLIFAFLSVLPTGAIFRILSVLLLGGIAIFVHEAAIVMVMPVMYFAMYLTLKSFGLKVSLPIVAIVVAIHAGLTYWVGNYGILSVEEVKMLRETLQARADFELIDLPFQVLSTIPAIESQHTLRTINTIAHVDSIIVVLPVLAPLLAVTFLALKQGAAGSTTIVFATAAALSPIAMRAFGHDVHRWDSFALCTTYLTLSIVLREVLGPNPVRLAWQRITPCLIVLLIVGASTSAYLFLGQDIRGFPFLDARSDIVGLLMGR